MSTPLSSDTNNAGAKKDDGDEDKTSSYSSEESEGEKPPDASSQELKVDEKSKQMITTQGTSKGSKAMNDTSGAGSMAAASDTSAADRATIDQLRRENESQKRLIEELNAVILK